MKIFVDSDVIISALISTDGASHLLINQNFLSPIISNLSHLELVIVIKRIKIDPKKFETLLKKRLKILQIDNEIDELKTKYRPYVYDIDDAHIVAGAHLSKCKYLISYNSKHFHAEKIKKDLDILIMTPATFIQYLRSR